MILALFFFFSSCKEEKRFHDKGRSPIITEDGSFFLVELNINVQSRDRIDAEMSITNNSDQSVPFYKTLLPVNGRLEWNVFYVMDMTGFENVPFLGNRVEDYIKMAPDDDDGAILPKTEPDDFIIFEPRQKMSFSVNLIEYYNFSNVKKNSQLFAVYSVRLPKISSDFSQVKKTDPIDSLIKPVYFDVSLPERAEVDSMRVHFKL